MNWLEVADWCVKHTCFEFQRYGKCNCKGKGACISGKICMEACQALDRGNGTIDNMNDVYKYVRRKTCHMSRQGSECNHRGCIMSEQIQAWITEQSGRVAA